MNIDVNPYAFLARPDHMPRGSLAGHVAAQLREAIVTLRLRPGTMLDKTEICARLGVSRSPVAEAMARLQGEGLIEILPQRGSVVSLVSVAAVEEYIFVRKALEGETVRRLALDTPDGLVEALEDNLKAQRKAVADDDRVKFHTLDLQYHEILVSALAYKRVKSMVDTARYNLDRARRITNSMRRIAVGIEEHVGIVDAIRAGDPEAATQRMHAHLDSMVRELYALANKRPELFIDGELAPWVSE